MDTRRTPGLRLLCLWALVLLPAACLPACGHAGPVSSAPEAAQGQDLAAPTLRAQPERPWQDVGAWFERTVPDGGSGARVVLAIRDETGGGTVRVLRLHVIRSSVGPSAASVGLALTLEGTRESGRTHIRGLGATGIWIRGCASPFDQTAPGWGGIARDGWEDALAALETLDVEAEPQIRIRAPARARIADLLPFLEQALQHGFERLVVETPGKRFIDAEDDSLRWLPAHALKDGGWHAEASLHRCEGRLVGSGREPSVRPRAQPGLTGICLCAFLHAGYTNRGKHPFARTVSRGLRALKRMQDEEGNFAREAGREDARAHTLATWAMVEAHGMTGSPLWKSSAQRALAFAVRTWRAEPDDPILFFATATALLHARAINRDALRHGSMPPLEIPAHAIKEVLARAHAVAAEGEDHAHAMREGDMLERDVARYVRLVSGEGPSDDPDLARGFQRRAKPSPQEADAAPPPTLATYVLSVTARYLGGRDWDRWLRRLTRMEKTYRRSDGHACCVKGSYDPAPDAMLPGGRVAATAWGSLASALIWDCYHPVRR